MKEVKTPKKPLIYYYGIVLLVLIVFNLVVSPILMEHQVEETDYGTFMSMINDKNIGKVEVEDNQIVFTDKNNEKLYRLSLRLFIYLALKRKHTAYTVTLKNSFEQKKINFDNNL